MQIPAELRQGYDEVLNGVSFSALSAAAQTLSLRYREATPTVAFIQSEIERLAYVATRLPATYAAAHRVLAELRQRAPALALRSVLDLGAGSGAASWAAVALFDSLETSTLYEQDRALIVLGQRLAAHSSAVALTQAEWQAIDLRTSGTLPPCDLIVASYALGELPLAQAERLAQQAWQATGQALVLIEPGTIRGFATLRSLRDALLAQGAHLLAPCPHAETCPMTTKQEDDWCHFAARVERTALQRRLKGGTLNYEDEKFAYLIFTKTPQPRVTARVLRHPQRQAGFAALQLCTLSGLQTVTITKRNKEVWRQARKVEWGDVWD